MTYQKSIWTDSPSMKSYTLSNFRQLPQIQQLSEEKQFEMEVVGNVLPFKVNNYVIEQLINWNDIPNDPIFVLTFPQKGMLKPKHYEQMSAALKNNADKKEIATIANEIRLQLNPHPAGQMELNVPTLKDGTKLYGMQHKYRETCLFFPSQSQTCHAYCSFCFRWPQFVGMDEMKFAMQEGEQLVQYLREHPEITDVLFTGGDPMIMKAKIFAKQYGLIPRLHADEFEDSNAASFAAKVGAVSADHLMAVSNTGINDMAKSGVIATLLPGTTFFLGKNTYANGRKMIDAGCDVAIASDFNPGSCTLQSMPMVIFLSTLYCGLSMEEAFVSATYNGAKSINRENQIGAIQIGYKADLLFWDIESIEEIPYWLGSDRILSVMKNGELIQED